MLDISHTPAEGTIIAGTERGDGSADVLKAFGWRWGRSIAAWYVPRSRDRLANRGVIDRTRVALEAAGFEVMVSIEDGYRDAAEVEQDRRDRAEARAQVLEARAERSGARVSDLEDRANSIAKAIPFGQPILVGHHSEARHRRDLDRIRNTADRAVEEARKSADAAAKARASRTHAAAREAPSTVANRLRKLEAERKSWASALENAAPGTAYAARAQLEVDRLTDELDYWAGVRAHQIDSGQALALTPEHIAPGDLVKVARSGWWLVERVNKTTVTVVSRGCRIRTPYDQLEGHRPGSES